MIKTVQILECGNCELQDVSVMSPESGNLHYKGILPDGWQTVYKGYEGAKIDILCADCYHKVIGK